jgi:hypothetical protein
MKGRSKGRLATCLLLALFVDGARGENRLVWKNGVERVDARIETWNQSQILEQISLATGWEVYVEPGAKLQDSTTIRFKNFTPGDALGRLLNGWNFAVVPHTNGISKLMVFNKSAQDATQLLRIKPGRRAIGNELIVVAEDASEKEVEELAAKYGGRVTGRVKELDAYRLEFPNDAAANKARPGLAGEDAVDGLDSNYEVLRPPPPQILSGSTTPAIDLKPAPGNPGNQTIVAMLDTPIQRSGTPTDAFLLPGISIAGEAQPGSGQPTHGTSMSEIFLRVLSLAPQDPEGSPVRILPVDIYGDRSTTTTFDVARGISEAIKGGASIINMSLGGEGSSLVLERIVDYAHEHDIVLVAAAGNEPMTTPTYPAAYPQVLAVTAGDRRGNVAPYANRGDFVDVVAPGAGTITFNGRSYLVSGTSASTAYISGMTAGLAASSRKRPSQVESIVRRTMAFRAAGK